MYDWGDGEGVQPQGQPERLPDEKKAPRDIYLVNGDSLQISAGADSLLTVRTAFEPAAETVVRAPRGSLWYVSQVAENYDWLSRLRAVVTEELDRPGHPRKRVLRAALATGGGRQVRA